jgi:condensin complex subunit 3
MLRPLTKAYKTSLKSSSPDVQSTGATALAKLQLSRILGDADLLKSLVVTFFDPDSADNAQLRQSLSYFLPVYCHSRKDNAAAMAEIAPSVVAKLQTLRQNFLDDDDEDVAAEAEGRMVSMSVIAGMLVDWTDPRKVVGADGSGDSHLVLAEAILERLVTSSAAKEERKILLSMLGKVHLPTTVVDGMEERVKGVLELLAEAVEGKVATDATGRNVLAKVQTGLLKLMHDVCTAERGGGDETTVLPADEVEDEEGEEEEGDATELSTGTTTTATTAGAAPVATPAGDDDDDEDEDEEEEMSQLQQDLKDATLGATLTGFGFTTGLPDAEGTRIQLDVEDEEEEEEEEGEGDGSKLVDGDTSIEGDTEMMDVDG